MTPAARKCVSSIGTPISSHRSCTVQKTLWQSPTTFNSGATTESHQTFIAIGFV